MLVRSTMRLQYFADLVEIIDDTLTPEPEKLDRMMRYQTTINRQLSTAIGELLALTRQPPALPEEAG